MATAGDLEEHITCSVCLEICRDPHILRCVHTFCLSCLQQLQQEGRIQCPECREYTDITDIKKDFKLQSFIDLHDKQTGCQPGTASETFCEVCENPGKIIASNCLDCGQHVCVDCEKAHQKFTATQNHRIISVRDTINNLQAELKKIQVELESHKSDTCNRAGEIEKSISDILHHQEQQLLRAQEYKDEMLISIERFHAKVVEAIKSANSKCIEALRNCTYICKQSEQQIQAKIDFISEIMKSEDVHVLNETVDSINAGLKEEIEEIKLKLTRINTRITTPVTIRKGEAFNPEKFVNVRITCTPHTSGASYSSFSQVGSNPYKQEIRKEFQANIMTHPQRLSIIENHLWCAKYNDGIFIFDSDCKLITKITHDRMKSVTGVTSTHRGDIIVACGVDHGLYKLSNMGKYLDEIADGSYSDVCAYEEKLYALDPKHCKIIVFLLSLAKGQWLRSHEIVLKFRNGSGFDKLFVCNAGIFVTSVHNHSLYVHSLEGEFLYQTGSKGSDEGGNFNCPRLSDVDSAGNVLVCDQWNHRLQMYDQDRDEWSVIRLQGEMEYPRDAAVNQQGDIVWIITDNKMIKYVKC